MGPTAAACFTPSFHVLRASQIETLYEAALSALRRTGVAVYHAGARELLASAGATVDGVRVRFPRSLIETARATAPSSFTLWRRDGRSNLEIAPDRVYFGPGPSASYFVDPRSGQVRRSRRGNPGMAARVTDALENLDFAMGLGLVDAANPELAPVYEFAEMVTNTSKPLLAWGFSVDNLIAIYRIASAVAGGEENLRCRPFLAWFTSMQPPLQHPDQELQQLFWAVDHGLPVVYTGCGIAGQSAPVTGAGLLVVYLMSALSALVIIQLRRPGAPACIGGVPSPMDLRTSRPSYGGPELSLYSAAMADISRYLDLPMLGTAGSSEAKTMDVQAAVESTIQVLLSGLSGATLVHDVGFLDCADIGSLEMLVLNDEIIAMVRRILRGIEVTDETMMLDLIDQIGPGGEYMSALETARRCRREIWMPTLMNREPWALWMSHGQKSCHDAIKERLQKILAEHQPEPLPPETLDEIDRIVAEAEAQYETRSHPIA